MTNILIDLSKTCDPSTRDCLSGIRDQAKQLNMDFLVVGALVRILILERYYAIPTGVETLDIDIGITVVDWEHYEKLRRSLISTGAFAEDKKNYHRLSWYEKYHVDFIPFGAVETSAGIIQWPPDRAFEMNVTGFQDALQAAILVRLSADFEVHFASLPAMAVLKLITWHERHGEFPTKDAVDIAIPDENDRLIVSVADCLPGKDYESVLALLQNLKAGILDSAHPGL